jgi:hypothetical protein
LQCTPDLLPADVTQQLSPISARRASEFHPLTTALLADEIKQPTPRRSRAAGAMQESKEW